MVQHVTAQHLSRLACLYVRQSTLQQVMENTESTSRQYALRERARALGWPEEHIVVIDQDLGHLGASAADRLGFQRLVAEVGLGHVGLVLGLEVSRLARNSSGWHQLLEICALTHTLILDEEGLYDPSTFNDRLLLGLKRLASYYTSCSTWEMQAYHDQHLSTHSTVLPSFSSICVSQFVGPLRPQPSRRQM
jgi:hypothetical protein